MKHLLLVSAILFSPVEEAAIKLIMVACPTCRFEEVVDAVTSLAITRPTSSPHRLACSSILHITSGGTQRDKFYRDCYI